MILSLASPLTGPPAAPSNKSIVKLIVIFDFTYTASPAPTERSRRFVAYKRKNIHPWPMIRRAKNLIPVERPTSSAKRYIKKSNGKSMEFQTENSFSASRTHSEKIWMTHTKSFFSLWSSSSYFESFESPLSAKDVMIDLFFITFQAIKTIISKVLIKSMNNLSLGKNLIYLYNSSCPGGQ